MWDRVKVISTIVSVGMLLAYSSAVRAAWLVKVDGPDVFGDTSVVAINVANASSSLIIQCKSSDQLEVAYIEKASNIPNNDPIPVQIAIQIDRGQPVLLDGEMKKWNDNYVAAGLSGRSADVVAAAKLIASAKDKVSIGYRLPTGKAAIIVNAAQGQVLARALTQSCKL